MKYPEDLKLHTLWGTKKRYSSWSTKLDIRNHKCSGSHMYMLDMYKLKGTCPYNVPVRKQDYVHILIPLNRNVHHIVKPLSIPSDINLRTKKMSPQFEGISVAHWSATTLLVPSTTHRVISRSSKGNGHRRWFVSVACIHSFIHSFIHSLAPCFFSFLGQSNHPGHIGP